MGPAANARTGRMAYVDCRGDYRITGVIYINGMAMSRGTTIANEISYITTQNFSTKKFPQS